MTSQDKILILPLTSDDIPKACTVYTLQRLLPCTSKSIFLYGFFLYAINKRVSVNI